MIVKMELDFTVHVVGSSNIQPVTGTGTHFAVTQDNEVIHNYGLTYDEVFLLRKSKLIQAYEMMPQTSKEELMVFISVYQMDLVTEYTGKENEDRRKDIEAIKDEAKKSKFEL